MADNLPLIPQKGAVCADVRPVLREVFRERDYLPPLPKDKDVVQQEDPLCKHWIKDYTLQCEDLWKNEDELKQEHARRVARETLPNIYRLSSPQPKKTPAWRVKHALIARKDLIPAIHQNAGRDTSLWVKNILNRSSCDVSSVEVRGNRLYQPPPLPPPDEYTIESLSIGKLLVRKPPPLPPAVVPDPVPDYILCIPPQLDFINFTVGQLHSQTIRLVNFSKFEVRLSLRPPARRELDVMLTGPRGLTVTAGAAAELRVRFTPSDVRSVTDALVIRASTGKTMVVPIYCYMQPPILEVMIPNLTWSSLSCTPGESSSVRAGSEVIELGAQLLGDVHCARLLLHCDAEHAAFFVLTEEAWLSYCLDTLTCDGAVISGPFTVSPAWWRGGGLVRGGAWCRAPNAGLHATALRVVASTAVARPLHLLADALMFKPKHLTLEAHEKNYDICSEDDPACEYYVNLGTAFPNRSLSVTVQLVNHSPVIYSYYWSVRPWGVCSCWEDERAAEGSVASDDDSERLCIGAKEARLKGNTRGIEVASLTRVEPGHGRVAPRSSCPLHVYVPDAGACLGVQRAVLMLILKDIPRESFPPDSDPMIVKTDMVVADPIPGHEPWTREVCEVVCLQLEVWWEVVPVRFVLDPPVLPLPHSRRVKRVEVMLRATQLFGGDGVRASWSLPDRVRVSDETARASLVPAQSLAVTLEVTLPCLPNEYPNNYVIELNAANNEWSAQTAVSQWCASRHPRLRPARAWLGIVPPAAHLSTALTAHNDTHQHICWWGSVFRWWNENEPSAQCVGQSPCEHCRERVCTCALLRPARGALHHDQRQSLIYDVNAPDKDGCVATLIQVRRTAGDVAQVPNGAGTEARASLVFYRVLAPRVVLRALPCHGDRVPGECQVCSLDSVGTSASGNVVLRPSTALCVGRCTCYRLRLTNITPLPTSISWEEPIEKEDTIKVTFIPNDFDIGSYGKVEIRMVIKSLRVCGRRIFVYRAKVAYSHKPLYLLVDAAVAGLEISCEIPLGGGTTKDDTLVMMATQKEQFPWEPPLRRLTPEEAFLEEDRKRAVRTENICHCKFKMVYIPKVKPLKPPKPEGVVSSIEIITEPPPFTRVCACDECSKPTIPELNQPGCLQFRDLPLRTVRSRTIVVYNKSVLTARWQTAVRNWPRKRNRVLTTDPWALDVKEPGIVIEVMPPSGVLGPSARIELTVSVYADCWGLYRDQVLVMVRLPIRISLVQDSRSGHSREFSGYVSNRGELHITQLLARHEIDKLEPLVLDVWVEVVGKPLTFSMKPSGDADDALTLWMSSSDPNRTIRVKNTSRSELVVNSYVLLENGETSLVLREHCITKRVSLARSSGLAEAVVISLDEKRSYEHPQDVLPFRMYLRFFDVLPKTCPCVHAYDSPEVSFGEETAGESIPEEMDTGIEVFFTADYGQQTDTYFKVEPEVTTIAPGAYEHLQVTFESPDHGEMAPNAVLLLRPLPKKPAGPGWYRREPGPQMVRLQPVQRTGVLRVSDCKLRVKYCALGLPQGEIMRIRKTFRVLNVGNGHLDVQASTEGAWSIVVDGNHHETCGAGCGCGGKEDRYQRTDNIALHYQPMSSNEMSVEVCIYTSEAWPRSDPKARSPPSYEPLRKTITPLYFYDDDNVLMTIPLILELEYPIITIEPSGGLDFGFVMDGDTRKSYFTVSHSSRTETIEVVASWLGSDEFQLWPKDLRLPPGAAERVYVQYTAKWRSGSVEGAAIVEVHGGAGAWCRTSVTVRAAPARDRKCHAPVHDHTDDAHLLPPNLGL